MSAARGVTSAGVPGSSSSRIVELSYLAPSECKTHDFIVERIRQMVRHVPPTPIAAKATIRHDKQYALDLELEGGRRRVNSESCNSLVETLTVILALAIDPQARVAPPSGDARVAPPNASATPPNASATPPNASATPPNASATPPNTNDGAPGSIAAASSAAGSQSVAPASSAANAARAASTAASSSPAASAIAEPEPPDDAEPSEIPASGTDRDVTATDKPTEKAETPSRTWSFAPTLLAGLEYGMLPGIGYGPRLGLWIDRDRWTLAFTGDWLIPEWTQMPASARAATSVRRGGHISYLGGQGQLCYLLIRRATLLACLGGEAGDLMGNGDGVPAQRLGHGLWLAGVGTIAYRPKLWSRLNADLRLGFSWSVVRPKFGFFGDPWAFEPEPWSLRLSGGFSWTL